MSFYLCRPRVIKEVKDLKMHGQGLFKITRVSRYIVKKP